MKISSLQFRALSVAILCAIAPVSPAQTTATTTPVGFVTRTIPAAVNSTTPSNTTVSIPLYAAADYVSTVASIDSVSQFTLTGAAWIAAQFAASTAPRLVRVKTSTVVPANVGKFLLITANTTNQLTVALPSGVANINTVLSIGDTCEILPATTLGTVFGTASSLPTLTAGATANSADNVLIWSGTGWDTYYWTGIAGTPNNIWKKTGNIDRSNTVIYPDEAVFVIRRDTSAAATVTLMGVVPSTYEQSDIEPGSTFLSNRFPVDMTLGTVINPTLPALNLQNIPGWVAGATANSADKVFIRGAGGWDTYYWTGTVGTPNNIWKRTGTTDRSDTLISAGTGVFISHAGSKLTLTQVIPYTP